MAQIHEFTSTSESYFILDGVKYPKVYEARVDSGFTTTRLRVIGTNRDDDTLLYSTHYLNVRVDGLSFNSLDEALSAINEVVFSKGGGSGDGGTTGAFIPLTGTEEGKPVTGDIKMNNSTSIKIGDDFYMGEMGIGFLGGDTRINLGEEIELMSDYIYLGSFGHLINYNKYSGLSADMDYTYDMDGVVFWHSMPPTQFIQKSYIDYLTMYKTPDQEPYNPIGRWIDGKPIYENVLLTSDDPPLNMETQFPNIIVGDYTIYKYTLTTD